MSAIVHLPDELAARVAAAAAERGVTVDEVAVEAIEAALANPPRLGFIALGRSGRSDLSARHKEIRRELLADQRAADA